MTEPRDSNRLPGVTERIRRIAEVNASGVSTSPTGRFPAVQPSHASPRSTMAQDMSPEVARQRAAVQANMASLAALHHDDHAHGSHPTGLTYLTVGAILTAITAAEVWIYYIPSFVASKAFVPTLLVLSAVKFAIVVAFYMHLKYDNKLFRALFTGPLLIAAATCVGLMFLFGHFAIRLGLLQ